MTGTYLSCSINYNRKNIYIKKNEAPRGLRLKKKQVRRNGLIIFAFIHFIVKGDILSDSKK